MGFGWIIFGSLLLLILYMGHYENAWENWDEDEPFPSF